MCPIGENNREQGGISTKLEIRQRTKLIWNYFITVQLKKGIKKLVNIY